MSQEHDKNSADYVPEYSKYVFEELHAFYWHGDIETGEGLGMYLCASDELNGKRIEAYVNYLADIIAHEVGYDRFEKWRGKNPLIEPPSTFTRFSQSTCTHYIPKRLQDKCRICREN